MIKIKENQIEIESSWKLNKDFENSIKGNEIMGVVK